MYIDISKHKRIFGQPAKTCKINVSILAVFYRLCNVIFVAQKSDHLVWNKHRN